MIRTGPSSAYGGSSPTRGVAVCRAALFLAYAKPAPARAGQPAASAEDDANDAEGDEPRGAARAARTAARAARVPLRVVFGSGQPSEPLPSLAGATKATLRDLSALLD